MTLLVALYLLGAQELRAEAEACQNAVNFMWFKGRMDETDAVVRDARPSIPDADTATQFLTLGLEYESASGSYGSLGRVTEELQSGPLPWPALRRSLALRREMTDYIASIYQTYQRPLKASELRRVEVMAGQIETADGVLFQRTEAALRAEGFEVDDDGAVDC